MYGFPPLKYDDNNLTKKEKKYIKNTKQRNYVNKSYINIRQILYDKKKEINWNVNKENDIDVINSI
jgi:uncharacterized membrane-anchored protein